MTLHDKIYYLKSHHGGKVLCRKKDSILFCSDSKYKHDDKLFSFVRCILIGSKIFIYSESLDITSIVSSGVTSQMPCFDFVKHKENKITISTDISNKQYVTALYPNSRDGLGHLQAGVNHIDEWEIFQLEEVGYYLDFENDFIRNFDFFLKLDASKKDTIVNFIKSYEGKYLDILLSHTIQTLSLSDLIDLKDLFVSDENIIHLIRKKSYNLFGKNINFLETSPPCSLDFYEVCSYRSGEILYDLFQGINLYIRKSKDPKNNICILATIRNEGIYILEWIAYHKKLGVDHFFIYSNSNDDGSEKILDILNQEKIITYIKNDVDERGLAQNKAYAHALSFNNDILDYKWCAIIDADEFIHVDKSKFRSLKDFLCWMDFMETDAVAMNWKFLKSKEIGNFQEVFSPLTSRNTNIVGAGGIGDGNLLIKSFFKPRKFLHSHPHHPCLINRLNYSYRLTDRSEHKYENPPKGFHRDPSFSDNYCGYGVTLLHFYFKSNIEWFWKGCRNRGDEVFSLFDIKKFNDNWVSPYRMQIEDQHNEIVSIDKSFLDELESLRELNGIKQAEEFIRKNFKEKFNIYYYSLINHYNDNGIDLSLENKLYFDKIISKIHLSISE